MGLVAGDGDVDELLHLRREGRGVGREGRRRRVVVAVVVVVDVVVVVVRRLG